MANTISIQSPNGQQSEYPAAAVIEPGMLVEVTAADEVQPHSTGAGLNMKAFAVEAGEWGGDITTDYIVGEQVLVAYAHQGDVMYGKIANGVNVAIGDVLDSAGDGTLVVNAAATNPVGTAREALNNTSGSNAHVKVRVA